MTPAQMAAMRNMGVPGANGLPPNTMMRPPVLPRTQQPDMALNGMGANGMQRQGSVGDLRAAAAVPPAVPSAAGLSINTGMNAATPTHLGSPNPAMLVDPTLSAPPATPRQASQPPAAGSPFPTGAPGSADRKVAPPLSRTSTGDVFGSTPATASAAATSGAAASAPATQIIPQLPPLPANVSLNPKVTRVSVVPLIDSETTVPALKEEEIARVQAWMAADREYEARYKTMRERMGEEVAEAIGRRRAWYEKDPLDDPRAARRRKEKFELVGLKTGKEDKVRRKAGRREGFKLCVLFSKCDWSCDADGVRRCRPRTVNPEEASRPEQLVPIRLEFDVEHHKMRDTFLWNLNGTSREPPLTALSLTARADPIITPEIFAQSVVDDYSLAPSYHAVITKAIQDQLSDFRAHTAAFGEDGFDDVVLRGGVAGDDAHWWDAWREYVRSDAVLAAWEHRGDARGRKRRKVVKDEAEEPELAAALGLDAYMDVDEFEEDESKNLEEMRILIKVRRGFAREAVL